MWNVFDDVWHAAKATTGRRGVSLTIVAALTLGIGLAIVTFTLVDAILLRPLPYPASDELLSMCELNALGVRDCVYAALRDTAEVERAPASC